MRRDGDPGERGQGEATDPAVDALMAGELQAVQDWLSNPRATDYPDHRAAAHRLHCDLTRRFG
ncbi:hypothetical protein [Gemmobacter caeruleus]|uniref:hypothetical protein n=1 Tax=Gemmobacter caeruleus TaxID=2595004 RepID=UPI0011ED94AF|nr:hypothetical protein [Gemmobacter caeruleus]